MRTSIRHAALVLIAVLLAAVPTVAIGPIDPHVGLIGIPRPPRQDQPEVAREGRLATPPAAPLCVDAPARHRGEEQESPSPGVLAVPILAYHYIRGAVAPGDALGWRLSVTPHDFAVQMDLLLRSGAHAVTLDDLVAAMHGDVLLPPHAVVLTFDDGYADFATNALPVLERDHLCATLFVVPGYLGRSGYLSAGQLGEVVAAGVRIGAHTMNHLDLPHQPPAVAADEISRSGDVLRALSGQPVRDFAYPYGNFDANSLTAVQSSGFTDAVALQNGLPESWDARYALVRIEALGGESPAEFAADAGVASPGAGTVDAPWQQRLSQPAASGVSRSSSATSPE